MVPDTVPDTVPDLTDNQKAIIKFNLENDQISMIELSVKVGISKRKIILLLKIGNQNRKFIEKILMNMKNQIEIFLNFAGSN